jgi:DNA primase
MDPADYLGKVGVEAFRQLAADAPDAIDHKLSRVTAGVDLTRDTHRAATAMETMLQLLVKAPKAANGLRIQQLLVRFSRTFGVATEELRNRLDQLRKQQRQRAPEGRLRSQVSSQKRGPRRPATPSRGTADVDPNLLLAEAGDPDSDGWRTGEQASPNGSAEQASPAEPAADPGRQPILGIDRELFEIMIEDPEFAPKAIEAIDPDWLETDAARSLMQAYQDLDLEGRELNLETLLLVVDSDGLKNTIVTMEERVRRREGRLTQTPAQRYASVIKRYHQMNWMAEKARQLAALSQEPRSVDEEAELLKRMFEGEKVVKGLLGNPKASITDSH